MRKSVWLAAIIILALFGAGHAAEGNIAMTVWYCSAVHVGLYFLKDGADNV